MGPIDRKDVDTSIVNDDTFIIIMPSARSGSKDQRNRSGQGRDEVRGGQLNDLDATQRQSSRSRDFDTGRRNVPVGDARHPEDNLGRSSSRDRSHDEPGMWSPPEEDPWSFRDQQGRVEPRSSFSQGRKDGSADSSSRRDGKKKKQKADKRDDRSRSRPPQNQSARNGDSEEGGERAGRSNSREPNRDSGTLQRSSSKDGKDTREKPSKKSSNKDSSSASQSPRDLKYLERNRETMARINSNGRPPSGNMPRPQDPSTGNRSRPRERSDDYRSKTQQPLSQGRGDPRPSRNKNPNGSVEIPMENTRISQREAAPPYTSGGSNYVFVSPSFYRHTRTIPYVSTGFSGQHFLGSEFFSKINALWCTLAF